MSIAWLTQGIEKSSMQEKVQAIVCLPIACDVLESEDWVTDKLDKIREIISSGAMCYQANYKMALV